MPLSTDMQGLCALDKFYFFPYSHSTSRSSSCVLSRTCWKRGRAGTVKPLNNGNLHTEDLVPYLRLSFIGKFFRNTMYTNTIINVG